MNSYTASFYCRFCKNAIFQNFGNIKFFRRFAFFFFFFLPLTFLSRVLTDLHQIWHERPTWYAIYTEARDFFLNVQKPGHNGQKTWKNRSFFHPAITFSVIVTKR